MRPNCLRNALPDCSEILDEIDVQQRPNSKIKNTGMKRNTIKFITMAVVAGVFAHVPVFAADSNDQSSKQKKPGLQQKTPRQQGKGSKATSAKTGEDLGRWKR